MRFFNALLHRYEKSSLHMENASGVTRSIDRSLFPNRNRSCVIECEAGSLLDHSCTRQETPLVSRTCNLYSLALKRSLPSFLTCLRLNVLGEADIPHVLFHQTQHSLPQSDQPQPARHLSSDIISLSKSAGNFQWQRILIRDECPPPHFFPFAGRRSL